MKILNRSNVRSGESEHNLLKDFNKLILALPVVASLAAQIGHAAIQNVESPTFDNPHTVSYSDNGYMTVTGRYYWRLVFSYDNTGQDVSVTKTITINKSKKLDIRSFISSTSKSFSRSDGNIDLGAKLNFNFITASNNANYSIHRTHAIDLVNNSNNHSVLEESSSTTTTITIRPNSKYELYQLVYDSLGVQVVTDIESSTPRPDVFVNMTFSVDSTIPGLDEFFSTLLTIDDMDENKSEWKRLHISLIEHSHRSDLLRLDQFVKLLTEISPQNANIDEFTEIRRTATQILSDWDKFSKTKLFEKLLTHFQTVEPLISNRPQWKRIRELSSRILNQLKRMG